jgi:hypothetical protein
MRMFYDIDLAVANLWAEARGESLEGKIAVAEVVRTRTKRRYASNGTIASTIFWPYQFSGFNTDNAWRSKIFELDNIDAVVRECFEAWGKSEHTDLTHGAVLYCNLAILRTPPSWAREDKKLAVIGQHSFFSD